MNLLATLNEVVTPDVRSRIALHVDEPEEKSGKAIDALVYTVIGGLMKRTTSEIGVNQLFNHIQKGRYDGSLTDNLANVLRDPGQTNVLITQGNDVISHLLPAMKSSIGNMISTYASIRNSSAISLLGLVATVVLHILGKQVRERKLDADGLAASLFSEREPLVNAVPEEFMPRLVEKVGLQQVVAGLAMPARRTVVEPPGRTAAGTPGAGVRPVTTPTRPTVSYDPVDLDDDSSSLGKWGVGALLALAVAVGGYYLYQNTQKHNDGQEAVSNGSPTTSDTAKTDTVSRSLAVPVDAAGRPASVTAAKTTPTAAVSGAAAAGSLTQRLTPYLSNAALPKGRVFAVPGLAFQPGSLSMTPGAQATIGELTTLLKTYPALQIQLIGYANDARGGGMTNKSLSFKRVNQIKQQLMASGIDFVRVDAIGRGSGVVRRDTSGIPRPTLRKIDMRVVVK